MHLLIVIYFMGYAKGVNIFGPQVIPQVINNNVPEKKKNTFVYDQTDMCDSSIVLI